MIFALALACVAGLLAGLAFLPRAGGSVRSETQLVEVLGVPMLAARPLAPAAIAAQLVACWFGRGRRVLPIVSAESSSGGTRAAVELARALAESGEKTLLIDANLRAPRLHAELGLPNRAGLADFLDGRTAALAHCDPNLSVLVAGRAGSDPLDLLSRERMQALLAEAVKRYSAVLVDTPAAAHGPDLQLFAAYGGGALVVARRAASPTGLARLRRLLSESKARVVGTVFAPG